MNKDGASIPDEEWERFLRDSEAGVRDAPKEPSARARMVTRRLAEAPDRPDAWRSYQPAPKRRRTGWYAVGILVSVALLVVAVAPNRVAGWFSGDFSKGSSADGSVAGVTTPLADETARPTAPPAADGAGELPTLEEPFRGSPAAAWKDGVAGIHLPDAKATGWMTKAQVADALARTRDFLVATSLDPATLRGERPEAAIAQINPQQKDMRDYLATAFRAPDKDHDPLMLFSRFRPSQVRLAGDVVKTRGRVTIGEGKLGALEVTADISYVYPLVRAAAGSDEVARTIVRRETVVSWSDPAKVRIDPGTFSLVSYTAHTANGGCDPQHGYFAPEFADDRATTDEASGPAVDPYDRSTAMDDLVPEPGEDAACGRATRT
ncbi:hypothetical protein OHT52_16540 [Streptomyces sp. NBC_00247]|uniref:hypothetical protein n=1 Tax=Streptomyces sp. NBC_00247 TaxID=2975689 RepID=UPI002E29B1E2|nr:hypothetical protein [Streptomyces sp. NBC_00247]